MADYPVNLQVDVLINKPLSHSFDRAVDQSSLFSGSVVLYDSQDNHTVDGLLSYDVDTFTVSFLPETALTPETSYTWSFAGADDPDLFPLKFDDATSLATSIFIDFQTGSDILTESDQLTENIPALSVIEDGQTIQERTADGFRVLGTTPTHLDSEVDVGVGEITITFSSPIKVGTDPEQFVQLSYESILRDTYLFNSTFKTSTGGIPGKARPSSKFDMPTMDYALSTDRTQIVITKQTSSRMFNANAFVRIKILKSLLDENDVPLNGSQDETFYFLTQLFPTFTNVQAVLLALSEVPGMVSEEVVLRYILKNSFYIWQLSGRGFDIVNPPPAAISYVECATLIDLIDGKNIAKDLNKGKTMKLAELNISYDFPRNPESDIVTVRSSASICMNDSKKEIADLHGKMDFTIGVRGANVGLQFDQYRNRIRFGNGTSSSTSDVRSF